MVIHLLDARLRVVNDVPATSISPFPTIVADAFTSDLCLPGRE